MATRRLDPPGRDELDPPKRPARATGDNDARQLLGDLEPEAARLLDRHLKLAVPWYPHECIPYRQGRDYDKEPGTPDQPRLSGVARTAFEVNLLTEDNLPSYHRLIHGMFGQGDGAWVNWVGRWTAEEGRHSIVLRTTSPSRATSTPPHLSSRAWRSWSRATIGLRSIRCAALPTSPCRRSPRARPTATPGAALRTRWPTASWPASPPTRTSAPRSTVTSSGRRPKQSHRRPWRPSWPRSWPSRCPVPNSGASAARLPRWPFAGIYDLRIYRDEVVLPLVSKLRIFELEGLSPEADAARAGLSAFLEELDESARRLEERRAGNRERSS